MWLTKRAKTKIVKEAVDPILFEIGYPAMKCGDIDHGNIWLSEVEEGDLKKRISIQDDYGILKLVLRTNAYMYPELYADRDNVGVFTKTGYDLWIYETREEFNNTILIYKDLIKNSALSKLEELSVQTVEARPTKESDRYLYENHEQLYLECMKKWELDGKTAEEVWEYLEGLTQESRNQKFKEVELLLIEIAAVYGTILIREFGGRWVWNDSLNNTLILDVGCDKFLSYPLNQVITHWRDETIYVVFSNLLRNFRLM